MHYTVLVIGENPEEQLAPFNEDRQSILKLEEKRYAERYKKDGEAASKEPVYIERHSQYADRWQDWQDDLRDGKAQEPTFEAYVYEYYYGEIVFLPQSVHQHKPEIETYVHKTPEYNWGREPTNAPNEPRVSWGLTYSNRFAILDAEGKIADIVYYATPLTKWDWYVLGGRWKNFYKVKPDHVTQVNYENTGNMAVAGILELQLRKVLGGSDADKNPRDERVGYADQLRKDSLDIEGQREDARNEAHHIWEDFHRTIGYQPFKTYDEFLAEHNNDHKAANATRDLDPVDQLIQKSDFIWYDQDQLKEFRLTREAFGDLWASRCLLPYSVLHNGVWHDREIWYDHGNKKGQYGYQQRPEGEWTVFVNSLIDSLPGDTLLSLYDYHC